MAEYQVKPGERHGDNWLIAPLAHHAGKYVRFDSNHWKSFVHARLAMALGDKGGLSLFGRNAEEHRLFAQHVVGEAPTLVTANGRNVHEWRPRPGAEVHWLDTLVGNAVAASMCGAAVEGREPTPAKLVVQRKTLSQMKAEAQARRLQVR